MTPTPPPDSPASPSVRLSVLAVPAFKDNYLWVIHDGVHAAVVDPGDAEPVIAALSAHRLTLTAILLTHHHADHIGGVPALLRHAGHRDRRAALPVFGPRHDGIDAVTGALDDGDRITVPGIGLALRVLEVPGHTLGHIAYVSEEPGIDWLFCGDTLFAAGCGRLFEGTPAQMRASLQRLAALPDDTLVYCAHEYTMSNLRFAATVEPGNEAIARRLRTEQAKRDAGQPTLPSTIGLEHATNPFLRDGEAEIAQVLRAHGRLPAQATPAQVFAALREWKNNF